MNENLLITGDSADESTSYRSRKMLRLRKSVFVISKNLREQDSCPMSNTIGLDPNVFSNPFVLKSSTQKRSMY